MKTYRKIMDAKQLLPVMQLPDFLHNEKVEIIVTPLVKRKKKSVKRKSAMGLLKEFADPALMEQEKQAWERHVKDKYGIT